MWEPAKQPQGMLPLKRIRILYGSICDMTGEHLGCGAQAGSGSQLVEDHLAGVGGRLVRRCSATRKKPGQYVLDDVLGEVAISGVDHRKPKQRELLLPNEIVETRMVHVE